MAAERWPFWRSALPIAAQFWPGVGGNLRSGLRGWSIGIVLEVMVPQHVGGYRATRVWLGSQTASRLVTALLMGINPGSIGAKRAETIHLWAQKVCTPYS